MAEHLKVIRPQRAVWNHVKLSSTAAAKTDDNNMDGREEGSYICLYEITFNQFNIQIIESETRLRLIHYSK